MTFAILATAAVRALAAAALLLAVSLVGFSCLGKRLVGSRARLAAPFSLSAGAGLVGGLCWIAGTFVGSRAVPVLFLALLLPSLRHLPLFVAALRRAAFEIVRLLRASPAAAVALGVVLSTAVPHLAAPLV